MQWVLESRKHGHIPGPLWKSTLPIASLCGEEDECRVEATVGDANPWKLQHSFLLMPCHAVCLAVSLLHCPVVREVQSLQRKTCFCRARPLVLCQPWDLWLGRYCDKQLVPSFPTSSTTVQTEHMFLRLPFIWHL